MACIDGWGSYYKENGVYFVAMEVVWQDQRARRGYAEVAPIKVGIELAVALVATRTERG
jgi:hypothetical protein